MDLDSPKKSTSKVFPCYGPLRRIFYALWVTTADFIVYYGPLRRIWFYAMGHCGGFGYALWATARNEAVQ
jgi:hypothetical protein